MKKNKTNKIRNILFTKPGKQTPPCSQVSTEIMLHSFMVIYFYMHCVVSWWFTSSDVISAFEFELFTLPTHLLAASFCLNQSQEKFLFFTLFMLIFYFNFYLTLIFFIYLNKITFKCLFLPNWNYASKK